VNCFSYLSRRFDGLASGAELGGIGLLVSPGRREDMAGCRRLPSAAADSPGPVLGVLSFR
jgi:hypothetical protein